MKWETPEEVPKRPKSVSGSVLYWLYVLWLWLWLYLYLYLGVSEFHVCPAGLFQSNQFASSAQNSYLHSVKEKTLETNSKICLRFWVLKCILLLENTLVGFFCFLYNFIFFFVLELYVPRTFVSCPKFYHIWNQRGLNLLAYGTFWSR